MENVKLNLVDLVKKNPILSTIYFKVTVAIEIVLFYVFHEYLVDDSELNLKPRLENLEIGFLKPVDIKMIALSDEVNESEEQLLNRLDNDCMCLGIKHKGSIAAYSWCNLRFFDYGSRLKFKLKDDEAYLFDARTFQSFRGKNLAPFLRYQLYLYLTEMGQTKFFSTSSILNTAAVKFKEKLQARKYRMYLYICFFKKIRFRIRLKKYFVDK